VAGPCWPGAAGWAEPWPWSEADPSWLLKPTPLGPSHLEGAVGSLGSNYHLPVNCWSSPSLLCKVCRISPVDASHVKILAESLRLGRLVPAAGIFPTLPFGHQAPPRRLDDRKPALLPQWVLGGEAGGAETLWGT